MYWENGAGNQSFHPNYWSLFPPYPYFSYHGLFILRCHHASRLSLRQTFHHLRYCIVYSLYDYLHQVPNVLLPHQFYFLSFCVPALFPYWIPKRFSSMLYVHLCLQFVAPDYFCSFFSWTLDQTNYILDLKLFVIHLMFDWYDYLDDCHSPLQPVALVDMWFNGELDGTFHHFQYFSVYLTINRSSTL